MKTFMTRLRQHPAGILYSILLAVVALITGIPVIKSGNWESGAVNLITAGILIYAMLRTLVCSFQRRSGVFSKAAAWGLLLAANGLLLLPGGEFPGSLSRAFSGALLICAVVLSYSGPVIAFSCIAPTLWCCVYMPYHEELMLFASYPLRLSATMLSAEFLRLTGTEVLYAGSSIQLPGLDIAITDACSGINQLDAFLLIAYFIVHIMHKKTGWRILHFAFIIPAIIAGNTIRIVLTIRLYRLLGSCVLENTWHSALGYLQIILALLFFLLVGRIFSPPEKKNGEVQP